MNSSEQEQICRAIDQRNKDKMMLRSMEREHGSEDEIIKCSWTGNMYYSNYFVGHIIEVNNDSIKTI